MRKKIVTLGDVMMRLSTQDKARFVQASGFDIAYGGAEANVAISMAQFGLEAAHVTAFPANDLGHAAIAYLRRFGVQTDQIRLIQGRLGLYFFEDGAMQRAPKIVYDRYDSAFANFDGKDIDWDMVFDGVDWFHWTGITPALSEKAAALALAALESAHAKGILVSADINYRRNLWQYGKGPLDIMPALVRYSHVLVAGLSDFENCLDIVSDNFEDACRMAKKDFPQIKYITKTKRDSISASHNKLKGYLWNGTETLKSKTYNMPQIVDRVGAGDAYIAGLIYGLLHFSDKKAVEFATAASVLKHSVPGDANLVTVEEVETLIRGENIGKLMR